MLNDPFTFEMSDGRVFTFKGPDAWDKNCRNQDLPAVERYRALIIDYDAFVSYPEITNPTMTAIMDKYVEWVKKTGMSELWKRGVVGKPKGRRPRSR